MKSIVRASVVMVVLLEMFAHIGLASEMRTVLFLHTGRTTPMAQKAVVRLEEKGFVKQKNMMLVWIAVSAETNPAQVVAQVKEAAPDVVLSFTAFTNVIQVLEQLSVPVVTMAAVESFVDMNGVPTANVTGVHSNKQTRWKHGRLYQRNVSPGSKPT